MSPGLGNHSLRITSLECNGGEGGVENEIAVGEEFKDLGGWGVRRIVPVTNTWTELFNPHVDFIQSTCRFYL